MAHFAQLDENNIVTQVIVVANAVILDANGIEDEQVGVEFCQQLFGANTSWKQTSYNANFRKNYAGIGDEYNAVRDAFIAPQPYASWLLNEETCQWEAPIPYPDDGKPYFWNEGQQAWVKATDMISALEAE